MSGCPRVGGSEGPRVGVSEVGVSEFQSVKSQRIGRVGCSLAWVTFPQKTGARTDAVRFRHVTIGHSALPILCPFDILILRPSDTLTL